MDRQTRATSVRTMRAVARCGGMPSGAQGRVRRRFSARRASFRRGPVRPAPPWGIPLLPLVAGAFTVIVVATAIGSSQVSLTFSGEPPEHSGCVDERCAIPPGTAGPVSGTPEARTRASSPRPRSQASVPSPAPPPRSSRAAVGRATSGRPGTPSSATTPLTVAFTPAERWPGGYVSTAVITNKGDRPIDAWTLEFRVVDASVTHVWDVEIVRTGQRVVVRNRPDEPAIAPGESVEIGFAADGVYRRPRECRVNHIAC